MKLLITTLLSVLLSAQLSAQAQVAPNPLLLPATAPQHAGVFHPKTGLIPASASSRFGPDLIFNNSTLQNYYAVPGAGQEWIDQGSLLDRNQNGIEQVNGLNFTYCSEYVDPSQNSLNSVYRLYAEESYCRGPVNWPTSDCSYAIAGLPGGLTNGTVQCWFVELNLSGGFECDLDARPSTGLFSWSNTFDQDHSGPWLAEGGLNSKNAFVWYDSSAGNGNEFQGCFWFGTPPWGGFATQLYGNPNEVFSLAVGANDPGRDMYLQVSNQALVGGSVTVTAHEFDQTPITNSRLIVSTALDMNGLQIPGVGGIHVGRGAAIRYDEVSASGVHDFNSIPIQGTFYMQSAVESAPNQPTRLSNVMQVNVL